jgi:hypothetical protein
MNTPPFWARDAYQADDSAGRRHRFCACGWSFASLEDAKAQAFARAKRIFEAVLGGQTPERYAYDDRPIKEEVVDAVRGSAGPIAVITRNRHGALVLNTDPMYLRLTQKQECFRARLTSKPWRCGCPRPPNTYPWTDPQAEAVYRRWQAAYTQTDAGFRVCELLQTYGEPADIEAIGQVVEAHDRLTRVESSTPLA